MQFCIVTVLLCFAIGSAIGVEPVTNTFRYDKGITNNTLSSFLLSSEEEGFDLTHHVNVIQASDCVRNCMPDLADTMTTNFRDASVDSASLFLKDAWRKLSTSQICRKMEEFSKCLNKTDQCSDSVVELIGQTFKYMCTDHRRILDETLPCIRDQAEAVSRVCDSICHVTERMINVVNQTNRSTSNMGAVKTAVVNDIVGVCNSSMCYISCLQKRINENCVDQMELLTNTVFKSLAKDKNEGRLMIGLSGILTNALPLQCHYLLEEFNNRKFKNVSSKSTVWMLGEAINQPSSVKKPTKSSPHTVQPTQIPIYFNEKKYSLSCHLFNEANESLKIPDFKDLAKLLHKQYFEKPSNRAEELENEPDMVDMSSDFRKNPYAFNSSSEACSIYAPAVVPLIVGLVNL